MVVEVTTSTCTFIKIPLHLTSYCTFPNPLFLDYEGLVDESPRHPTLHGTGRCDRFHRPHSLILHPPTVRSPHPIFRRPANPQAMESSQFSHLSDQIFVQLVVRQAILAAAFKFSASVLEVLFQGCNPHSADFHSEAEAKMLADGVVVLVKSGSEAVVVNNFVAFGSMRATSGRKK
jgi:hypothetical protein